MKQFKDKLSIIENKISKLNSEIKSLQTKFLKDNFDLVISKDYYFEFSTSEWRGLAFDLSFHKADLDSEKNSELAKLSLNFENSDKTEFTNKHLFYEKDLSLIKYSVETLTYAQEVVECFHNNKETIEINLIKLISDVKILQDEITILEESEGENNEEVYKIIESNVRKIFTPISEEEQEKIYKKFLYTYETELTDTYIVVERKNSTFIFSEARLSLKNKKRISLFWQGHSVSKQILKNKYIPLILSCKNKTLQTYEDLFDLGFPRPEEKNTWRYEIEANDLNEVLKQHINAINF